MVKLQRILSGLVIIGVIIGAILISPIVFITFIGGPCPSFPSDIQIAIQRNGPGEWLPVVKELESFVPTFVSSLDPYYLEVGYTTNITYLIEQYHQESPGTVVRGSYNMTYDISHNSSHLHEVIHDLAYNESFWHYWEYHWLLPDWHLSWIYPSEDDTTFQFEIITDPTDFKATLEQYLLNFSTTLAEQEAFLYVTQELAFNRSGRTCLLTPTTWGNYPRLGRLLLTTTMGRPVTIMVIYFGYAS